MRILFFLLLISTPLFSQQTMHSIISEAGADPAFLSGWTYRRQIQVDNTGNTTSLNGDQIKIVLSASNFTFANAKTNGEDIRFTRHDGQTLLDYWIQSYNSGTETATIWIKTNGIPVTVGKMYIYYGNAGASAVTSYANTMRRFQTSTPNTEYLVRFADGSGTTPVNSGSAGGNMATAGGVTWNTDDLYGENTGSISTNGTTGVITKTGLLDTWSPEGHIKFRFKYLATGTKGLMSKRNSLGIDGNYVHLLTIANVLTLRWYIGASNKNVIIGSTLVLNETYEVSISWNEHQVFMFLNGVMQGTPIYKRTTVSLVVPPGTTSPFRLGSLSADADGAAQTFSTIQINDFVYQPVQQYRAQIEAYHENRTYYQKDERSKWDISRAPEFGGASNAGITETSLHWDGTQFILTYGRVQLDIPTQQSFTKTTATLAPNVSNPYGAETLALTGYSRTHSISKFGSTYYMYYREASTAGAIMVATSSDGITYTAIGTAMAVPGAGFGSSGFFNTSVVFDGTDYVMAVDAVDPTINYSTGIAKSTDPLGPFTLFGSNPKSTLQYGVNNYSQPSLAIIDGVFHNWYSAKTTAGTILPQDMYRSYSTDLDTWTHAYPGDFLLRERIHEYDQASDCYVMEHAGNSYMTYLQADNVGLVFYYNIAKFGGTLKQLVTDLSYQILAEET